VRYGSAGHGPGGIVEERLPGPGPVAVHDADRSIAGDAVVRSDREVPEAVPIEVGPSCDLEIHGHAQDDVGPGAVQDQLLRVDATRGRRPAEEDAYEVRVRDGQGRMRIAVHVADREGFA